MTLNLAPLAHLFLLGVVLYLACAYRALLGILLVLLVAAVPIGLAAAGGLALVAGFGWVFCSALADAEIWLFHAMG